jgi:Cu/Ag efflux protein CusF
MRHLFSLTALLALCAALPVGGVRAATATAAAASAPDARAAGVRVSTSGTVTAIDAAQRTVVIRNTQGLERSYRIDPSVQQLEGVKVGDTVRLDYLVAVAVALRKNGDGIREKVEAEVERQNPQDNRPGIEGARRTTVVADVVSINKAKQTVRLKGPEGRVIDVKVKDKSRLASVKPGDQVVAVLFEAVAVGVKPGR